MGGVFLYLARGGLDEGGELELQACAVVEGVGGVQVAGDVDTLRVPCGAGFPHLVAMVEEESLLCVRADEAGAALEGAVVVIARDADHFALVGQACDQR